MYFFATEFDGFININQFLSPTLSSNSCLGGPYYIGWNKGFRVRRGNLQPSRRSPFSCAWSLGAGRCSSVWKSMRLRKNCNDGHWAAGISCSISPPNCLATVLQGLSFEIKSLVDWRLRFGEIELVPFDKTPEKWALSSTSFVPSLPFLHPPLLPSPLLSLHLFSSPSLSHCPPNPFLPGWLCYFQLHDVFSSLDYFLSSQLIEFCPSHIDVFTFA